MLRKKKILTTALCAGGVVLSAVMAEDTTSEATTTADGTLVSQPFYTAVDNVTTLTGDKAGTWAGYGSVTNQSVGTGYTKTVGKPISGTNETDKHKLYLSVDGYVTCTAATAADKPATVDMMIQIAKPDEELALPTGEKTEEIQIAVGVDTVGSLKVYCKNRADETGWYTLDKTPHAEGEWHRVSFTFDYANQTCQIRLDGEPLMTTDGYLTSDPKGASSDIGSWYKLNTTEAKNLSSVKVVGSTAIDEVVIKEADSVVDALPGLADIGGSTGSVPNQWIAEQGITRAQAEAGTADKSGTPVKDKYLTGLPIGDDKTYAITAMKMTGEGNTLKATLTVPAMTPPEKVGETNVGRQNVIVYGSDPDSLTKKQVISSGATTVELTVEKKTDSGVTKIYYQLKNEEKTDSAATN